MSSDSKPGTVSITNSALLQDELLYELVDVIENGAPAGPTFLSSFGSLVEASVLHNVSFVDPLWDATDRKDPQFDKTLSGRLAQSSIVTDLQRAGVLVRLPQEKLMQELLEVAGSEYEYIDFLTDTVWTPDSFYYDREAMRLNRLAMFLADFPGVFNSLDLTDGSAVTEPDAIRLALGRAPIDNLIHMESLNHKADAMVRLTNPLRLNLYMVPAAVPHQLGSIDRANTNARRIYEEVVKKASASDVDDVGVSEYSSMKLPDLARIVLRDAKGDRKAIVEVIADLRNRHAGIRKFLAAFDTKWLAAKTRKERSDIQSEFNNALEQVEKEGVRKERLIYRIWDFLKEPTKIPQKTGDWFAGKGRREAVVGQVRGLRTFWKELQQAPTASNLELLQGMGMTIADKPTWEAADDLGAAVAKRCGIEA